MAALAHILACRRVQVGIDHAVLREPRFGVRRVVSQGSGVAEALVDPKTSRRQVNRTLADL